MKLIIGIIVVLGSVAGGFVLSHGHLAALWQPYELLVIGGAGVGALIIANPAKIMKAVLRDFLRSLKATPYNKKMYMNMLALMYDIFVKARKDGLITFDADVENPHESALFTRYPAILKNHHVLDFVTDYLRMMVSGNLNAMQLEDLMSIELDSHHEESHYPDTAVTQLADGLPAFGIVAAVLGIIITMGALGGKTEEIGAHVAAALVGTLLGVLLAYGFVAPIAASMSHIANDESLFFKSIKTCLVAFLNGYAPPVAVEFGRKAIPSTERPSFKELEEYLKSERA
ncbi:MAG: flagellar motor stator protein MotA [Gammaproteobacteria bacterium]|nr:flagellar motor stator protein MotA [Gammaproteobacteria bacterium]